VEILIYYFFAYHQKKKEIKGKKKLSAYFYTIYVA
jgi:hypothetical protein